MKATTRRPLFHLPALMLMLGVSPVSAAFVIGEATGLFTPSFRGESGTTYFGWEYGTWDGNPGVTPDVINGVPSISPSFGSLLNQAGTNDIVSSSGNIYTGVAGVNNAQLTLTIPTIGTVGLDGFTTIIIQGKGMGGFGFALDAFAFGNIGGIEPEYVYGLNAESEAAGQWWAKWEIPGNQASYTVDITGYDAGVGVVSVTDMVVDTWFSDTGYASDLAIVPEPSALILSVAGFGLLIRRRR